MICNNTDTRDKLDRITTRTETLDGTTLVSGYHDKSRQSWFGLPVTADQVVIDAQDRLARYGNTAYDYTAAGELKSKTTAGITTAFDYDNFGNLRSVTLPGDINIAYLTDGQHRRIGKTVNGELKQGFLYQDQLNPIAELDGDNNVVSRFVYGCCSRTTAQKKAPAQGLRQIFRGGTN